MVKNIFVVVFLAFFTISGSISSAEAQNDIEVVLKDSFYGGLLGTLIAGGVLLTKDKPGDNLEYLLRGGGIGIIGGAVYGIFSLSTGSVLEISEGEASYHFPNINVYELMDPERKVYSVISADLLSYRF